MRLASQRNSARLGSSKCPKRLMSKEEYNITSAQLQLEGLYRPSSYNCAEFMARATHSASCIIHNRDYASSSCRWGARCLFGLNSTIAMSAISVRMLSSKPLQFWRAGAVSMMEMWLTLRCHNMPLFMDHTTATKCEPHFHLPCTNRLIPIGYVSFRPGLIVWVAPVCLS